MANVVEIAKASITAYNDKNWSKVKDVLAANAVYDEKGTHRRIQGTGEIIEAWQGWAKAFPDSKATFVREFARGDTAVLEVVVEGSSHRAAAGTNGYHSGIEQAARTRGMPGLLGRRREGHELLAVLRHARSAPQRASVLNSSLRSPTTTSPVAIPTRVCRAAWVFRSLTAATNPSPARTARSSVILMRVWIPEVDEDAIAHVLCDETTEAITHGICDALLIGRNDFAKVFRVHACRQCR